MQFIGLSVIFGLGGLVFFFIGAWRRRQLTSNDRAAEIHRERAQPARRFATVVTLVLVGPAAASLYEVVAGGGWPWILVLVILLLTIVGVQIAGRTVAKRHDA